MGGRLADPDIILSTMDVSDYVAPNTVLKEVKVALNEAVWITVGP